MPTYDYRCLECEHAFEKFQGIKDPVLTECPECKGSVKRLIGAGAGLIFKGSGFYITDYRSKEYQSKAKAESCSGKPESCANSASGGCGTPPAKPESSKSTSCKTEA